MPTIDYKCRGCGETSPEVYSMDEDRPDLLYGDCDTCNKPTEWDRVWSAPAIGRVPGAGQSPARYPSQRPA